MFTKRDVIKKKTFLYTKIRPQFSKYTLLPKQAQDKGGHSVGLVRKMMQTFPPGSQMQRWQFVEGPSAHIQF